MVCFQETYNEANYRNYHPRGMKSIFEWRVNGFDRMGAAGVHKIGMGVLIGLEDWRTDVTMMARHLRYLRKNYWRTRFSINFPRMCPSEGGYTPSVIMSDRELAQLTFAFRIFDHDVDISYSRVPRQHDESRRHFHERRKLDRTRRLLFHPRGSRAVRGLRLPHPRSGHRGNPRSRLRGRLERLG